jgi:Spy/CpxP family protein refolding chaperone
MRGLKGPGVLVALYVLGIATGALGFTLYRTYAAPPSPARWQGRFDRERYVGRLTQALELQEGQRQQLDRILDDARDEFRKLRQTIAPQAEAIKQRARARISEMLTADQQQRFEAFVREWEAEKQRRGER